MSSTKHDLLSEEFKVACIIYEFNLKGKPIWFTKLCHELPHDPRTIMKALRVLGDWGMIKNEYGPTERNYAGLCYYITNEVKPTIKDVYEHFWSDAAVEAAAFTDNKTMINANQKSKEVEENE